MESLLDSKSISAIAFEVERPQPAGQARLPNLRDFSNWFFHCSESLSIIEKPLECEGLKVRKVGLPPLIASVNQAHLNAIV